jgi:cap2 methyltransferase
MSNQVVKPPWNSIQWFTVPVRYTKHDPSNILVEGDWEESVHNEIEALKESIQPYDRTELWDIAKRITNPYELISTYSSRLILPKSSCCIHPLSRSFFKMVELLTQLQFFDRHKDPKLRSLHICEGPGGFIEAFHYMADSKKHRVASSHAMSLKSTNQMIPGWRRATQFLQSHPMVHLIYGPTKTGNIYEPCNQDECVSAVGPGGAHLVTSDGGFDFSEDFQNQEKTILRLLVSSALILLGSVAKDGDIILKVFDCNSAVTRDVLYLLASCFTSWTLYKPATSRPCNSEWYFLGKSAIYKDLRKPILDVLILLRDALSLNEISSVPYKKLLETNPLESILLRLQEERCEKQMQALKEVLAFCKNKDSINQSALWDSQRNRTVQWCYYFRMPTEFRLSN